MNQTFTNDLEDYFITKVLEQYSKNYPKLISKKTNSDNLSLIISCNDDFFINFIELYTYNSNVNVKEKIVNQLNSENNDEILKCLKKSLIKGGTIKCQAFKITNDSSSGEISKLNNSEELKWKEIFPDIDKNFEVVLKNIEMFNKRLNNKSELKDLQHDIKNLSETIRNIVVLKDQRKELTEKINLIIKDYNEILNTEKEKHEKEDEHKYKLYSKQLDEWLSNSDKITDFKTEREFVLNLQNEIKEINIKWELKQDLKEKLAKAFEYILNKQNEERFNFEKEALFNYNNLKIKVDEALEIALNSEDLKSARELCKEVQNDFKGIKLIKEQREELYSKLQSAFEILNKRQNELNLSYETESKTLYSELAPLIEKAYNDAKISDDFATTKEFLKEVQSKFKGIKLIKEQREELYSKLQCAFEIVHSRQKESKQNFEKESLDNYINLKSKIDIAFQEAESNTEGGKLRELLKQYQNDCKTLKLVKEQRDELFQNIKEIFEILNKKQDFNKIEYEKESNENYEKLKPQVENAFYQSQHSTDFVVTRELLKNVQNQFKGLELKKEQREELYSKLQKAFETLTTRVDEFFKQKKVRWESKVKDKLIELETSIPNLEESITKDFEQLNELNNQLEVMRNGIAEIDAKETILNKIIFVKSRAKAKQDKIAEIEVEINELKNKIETNNI